jgi:hypothetical protein
MTVEARIVLPAPAAVCQHMWIRHKLRTYECRGAEFHAVLGYHLPKTDTASYRIASAQ